MKTVFFYIVTILVFGNIYAQQVTIYQNGINTVVRYINDNSDYDYTYSSIHNIGRDDGNNGLYSGSQNDIWRSEHSFSLGAIPSNATINQAQLQFFINGYQCSTCSLKVTKTTGQYSWGQLWTNVNNTNTIVGSYQYSSQTPVASTALKDAIIASLSSGTLYLGSMSLVEGENKSHANLELRLIVDYTVPPTFVSFTVDNNFTALGGNDHGTMRIGVVNRTIPLTGYSIQATVGQNLTLSANFPQNDNQGFQRIWHTGATNPSEWTRNGESRWPNQTHSFTVTEDDNNTRYVANLRKNYAISRVDQTEFDGTSDPSFASYIVEDNSGQISAPTQQTINNRTYNFAGWSDGNVNNPRTISPQGNETYNALYKYPHHSNFNSAFSNNGQRKCVRVLENNHILLVYESMGKIWLERSTDNGGTWSLLNGGKPISFGTAKHPVISQIWEHKFLIVYQKLNSDGISYSIMATYYNLYTDDIKDEQIVAQPLKDFSDETTVVIGNSRSGITDFLIVWHEEFYGGLSPEGGLYYRLGRITTNPDNPYGIIEFLTNGFIGSTSASSVNPTIACKDEQIYYPIKFHLVWQNNVSSSASTIQYREITYNGQQLTLGTEQVLSNGSGYTKNHNPSTTVMNDNIPRVTWRGERVNPGQSGREFEKTQSTSIQSKVLFTDPSVNYFWGFGSNVGKPNINRSTDNLKYIMAWSQNNSEIKRVDNTLDTNNIALLATLTGSEVQVVSGTNLNNMRAITLNNTGNLPYYFQTASVIPVPAKTESPAINGKGREGVVYNGDSQFFFLIGDVKVNGSEVDFVDVPASTVFSSDSVLNRYMQTETFTLNNSSEFLYSVQYGITDSAAVDNYLKNGNSISFAVELIDAATGALLGKFDEVTYNSQNIFQYENLAYEVNTEGIGNRNVYLRLVTSTNGVANYSISKIMTDELLIAKTQTKKINFSGVLPVTDYALSQNYPNPFNPVTTINYQIPKDGFVSLKVYDILGKEIATLVNSDKAQGKYTVEFDGSRFASGMYIYKLQSGDFVETRKMMLLK